MAILGYCPIIKEQLIFSTPTNGDTRHQCLLPFKRGDRLLTLNGDTITAPISTNILPTPRPQARHTAVIYGIAPDRNAVAIGNARTYRRIYTHAFRPFAQTDDFTTKLKKRAEIEN
ncbi:MAG: hypothetical protein IPL33_16605 [Sphingobacteriales bacterium]|nr:hypothetical protein [Sphingobacteriales bacterium]